MTPYQILAPAGSIIAILYAWNLVVRGKKTLWEAVLWTGFWGIVALIALFPNAVVYLTTVTGIQDRQTAVVITFLGILFFIVFALVIRLEELEQRLTHIVRQSALKDAGLSDQRPVAEGEPRKGRATSDQQERRRD
ncbi:MAG: DUF2304 domain-containing protein [Candidatus Peregrinibacteria bacterium]